MSRACPEGKPQCITPISASEPCPYSGPGPRAESNGPALRPHSSISTPSVPRLTAPPPLSPPSGLESFSGDNLHVPAPQLDFLRVQRSPSGLTFSNLPPSRPPQKDLPALQMPSGGTRCACSACGPGTHHVSANLRLPAPLHL